GRARLCIGTRESPATIVMLDGDALTPGGSAFVQIRVASPIAVAHGQRFILRDETAVRTLGGGRVLRCIARRRIRNRQEELVGLERLATGDAADRVAEILRAAGFSRPPDLQLAVQAGVEPEQLDDVFSTLVSASRWVTIAGTDRQVARGTLDGFMQRGRRRLERYHELHVKEVGCPMDVFKGWLERGSAPGLGRPLLDRMVAAKTVKQLGRYVCLPEHAPAMSAQDEKLMHKMLERFEALAFQPPAVAAVAQELGTNVDRIRRLIRIAISTDQLVEIGRELYLHAEHEHLLRQRVRDLVAEHEAMSVGQLRESLGSSRKYVVPFLEYLDRIGYTRRDGDVRRLVENVKAAPAEDE
ncbi:MAG: SelB C-terminal domain-containing protein, partial [Planctomycetes bacterium]|nr:SelB C-terminal domain-containing protein [Planctomycetota bacterium]